MSKPPKPSFKRSDVPAAKKSGFESVARAVFILLAVGAGLAVLAFGTCVVMMK